MSEQNLHKDTRATLVVFGATGDLVRRKLVPALLQLEARERLPEHFGWIAVSRSEEDPEALRSRFRESVEGEDFDEASWKRLSRRMHCVVGDSEDSGLQRGLRQKLEEIEGGDADAARIFYLALPPSVVPGTLRCLHEVGLGGRPTDEGEGAAGSVATGPPRIVLEKPFGRDLESACELGSIVADSFPECSVYRIDHYLGKEMVQNLLVLRFGNAIFEPLWNRQHVERVEITASEEMGAEGRGAFYDETGVLRDVVQNHVMQLLAFCAMEPPNSFEADEIRRRRADVLRALRPVRPEEALLGQYEGYREIADVAADSRTPTFAALTLHVDNWRWRDTPFQVRAGKRLAEKRTEIALHFRQVPHCLFEGEPDLCERLEPNVLRIRIQPDESITLDFVNKEPGERFAIDPSSLRFAYEDAAGRGLGAYERLLLDCIRGDRTLFLAQEEVEQAWRVLEPLLEHGEHTDDEPLRYAPGTAAGAIME